MTRLHSELRRLYGSPSAPSLNATAKARVPGEPAVRALCLALARPADWRTLARVWEGVQTDLDWPAPAIAVSGVDGLQLWFSLEAAVPVAQAQALLARLCARYLPEVPADRLHLQPAPTADELPPRQVAPERWAAFVTRDLASVFGDEPWLDLPPGDDAQADLLARLRSVPAAEVARLLPLASAPNPGGTTPSAPSTPSAPAVTDPRQFLLDVMNNPAVEMHLRIEAAKALLAAPLTRC
jgi:hypothetical protein